MFSNKPVYLARFEVELLVFQLEFVFLYVLALVAAACKMQVEQS